MTLSMFPPTAHGVQPGSAASDPFLERTWVVIALAILLVVAACVVAGLRATDYVGGDNDDVMRLVEVRDLLAGQNWFDTTQYRLGLDGGTLMHWSRLVDLPIAALISFFGLFLAHPASEAAALFVWPILLVFPVVLGVAQASWNIGGRRTMMIGLLLIVVTLLTTVRFHPGDIDHHNVQMALVVLLIAGLTAPLARRSADGGSRASKGHALAGVMAGLAIAVGVETTPLVATAGLVVALRWVWHGRPMASAATAFGLTLAGTVTAAFFATTPPHLYAAVTCDNLSLGFFSIATAGGAALAACAQLASGGRLAVRTGALLAAGAAVAAVTLAVAPQCLGNPLASLDPLLKTLWLDHVEEAQSMAQVAVTMPAVIGYGFAPGLLAISVCLVRIARNDRRALHLMFLALCLQALAVSVLQIRGATFLNLLSIFPLSLAAADLRLRAHRLPRQIGRQIVYVGFVLVSIPSIWALASIAVAEVTGSDTAMPTLAANACSQEEALAPLAAEPAGVVAAPSNIGAQILRFTDHRVLAAPYHRNQGGMLAELRIGLAPPDAARALLKRDGVTLLAFCKEDPQTRLVEGEKPDGLYAALDRGAVPPYLEPVASAATGPLRLYRVIP